MTQHQLDSCLIFIHFYVLEWQSDRGCWQWQGGGAEVREAEIFHVLVYSSIPSIVRAGPGQSQKLGILSWLSRGGSSSIHEPSPAPPRCPRQEVRSEAEVEVELLYGTPLQAVPSSSISNCPQCPPSHGVNSCQEGNGLLQG